MAEGEQREIWERVYLGAVYFGSELFPRFLYFLGKTVLRAFTLGAVHAEAWQSLEDLESLREHGGDSADRLRDSVRRSWYIRIEGRLYISDEVTCFVGGAFFVTFIGVIVAIILSAL